MWWNSKKFSLYFTFKRIFSKKKKSKNETEKKNEGCFFFFFKINMKEKKEKKKSKENRVLLLCYLIQLFLPFCFFTVFFPFFCFSPLLNQWCQTLLLLLYRKVSGDICFSSIIFSRDITHLSLSQRLMSFIYSLLRGGGTSIYFVVVSLYAYYIFFFWINFFFFFLLLWIFLNWNRKRIFNLGFLFCLLWHQQQHWQQ